MPSAGERAKALGAGLKFDTGKVRTDLLPAGALAAVDRVLTPGDLVADLHELVTELTGWRRGEFARDRMARVAAILLILHTRDIRPSAEPAIVGECTGLLPFCAPAVLDVARVLTFGAAKYGPNNWQKLDQFTDRYYAGLLRHLLAYCAGERIDPESGLAHLAHGACGALFLLSAEVGHDAT